LSTARTEQMSENDILFKRNISECYVLRQQYVRITLPSDQVCSNSMYRLLFTDSYDRRGMIITPDIRSYHLNLHYEQRL